MRKSTLPPDDEEDEPETPAPLEAPEPSKEEST
jgi:hypothetical protein